MLAEHAGWPGHFYPWAWWQMLPSFLLECLGSELGHSALRPGALDLQTSRSFLHLTQNFSDLVMLDSVSLDLWVLQSRSPDYTICRAEWSLHARLSHCEICLILLPTS